MQKRNRVSARRTVERHFNPGKAADYITHGGIEPGDKVVLCCRVSSRQQNQNGNLIGYERYLGAEIAARRAGVVEVVRHVGSGVDPLWVACAARIAKRHNAKLVAVTADRLIRHPDYSPIGTQYEQNARANIESLEDLRRAAGGVELVTLVDPDTPLAKCMTVLRGIGQKVKNRKGGRPKKKPPGYKKERRMRKQPEALRLHQEGNSIREIARALGVPASTVQRWVYRFCGQQSR